LLACWPSAQLLVLLTEDNEPFNAVLRSNAAYQQHLATLMNDAQISPQLRVLASGTVVFESSIDHISMWTA
jgi:hypothetical protein